MLKSDITNSILLYLQGIKAQMGILRKIFDKVSLPSKVTIQKSNIEGRFIDDIVGRDVSRWQYIPYSLNIYAKRNFNNKYDIYLKKHSDLVDYGSFKLKEDLSLHQAIAQLRRYDDYISRGTKDRKRTKRSHYEKVERRMFKKGIFKH